MGVSEKQGIPVYPKIATCSQGKSVAHQVTVFVRLTFQTHRNSPRSSSDNRLKQAGFVALKWLKSLRAEFQTKHRPWSEVLISEHGNLPIDMLATKPCYCLRIGDLFRYNLGDVTMWGFNIMRGTTYLKCVTCDSILFNQLCNIKKT